MSNHFNHVAHHIKAKIQKIKTIKGFTNTILKINNKNIPKMPTKPRKNKIWFNDACLHVVRENETNLKKQNKTNNYRTN